MKGKNLLIIGAIAVVGYMLWKKQQDKTATTTVEA